MIVFDLNNALSFTSIEESFGEIIMLSDAKVKALIGNKSDLEHRVTGLEIGRFAHKCSFIYKETSSINMSKEMDDIFFNLIERALDRPQSNAIVVRDQETCCSPTSTAVSQPNSRSIVSFTVTAETLENFFRSIDAFICILRDFFVPRLDCNSDPNLRRVGELLQRYDGSAFASLGNDLFHQVLLMFQILRLLLRIFNGSTYPPSDFI